MGPGSSPSIQRKRTVAAATCALFASFFWSASAASSPLPQPPKAPGIPGQSVAAGGALTETTGEIMARHTRMAVTAPQKTLEFFIGRADTSHKKVDPEAAGRRQGPATGRQSPEISGGEGPLLPQMIGVNADGPTSGSNPCGTPPDTMGAIGPTQFVVFENCNIVTYNKATGAADGVLNTTPDNFFNSVRSNSTSDPHVRYDRLSQRWFLLIIDVTFPNNRVLLAVSDSATITPSTVWSFFFFQSGIGTHTNCLADYPTPGIDANAIYVGVNQFCGSSLNAASYQGSDVFVVQKNSVLGGGPIHVTGFPSSSPSTYPFTPQGVDNADPSATEGYLIGVSNFSWSELDLVRVTNPGGTTPTLSTPVAIGTANMGAPIPQPHQGNTKGTVGYIDGSDGRLFAATLRGGGLWTAADVGVTVSGGNCVGVGNGSADRDAVFWWEIRGIPTGQTPSIHQAGLVCDTASLNPSFFSYATIIPNGQGHAAAGFTIAGKSTYISGGTAGRLSGDTLGSLQSTNQFAPGVAAYNPSWDTGSGYGYRRWGDYSFTSLDPCNDQSIWTIQEYVPVANQYGSRFAELKGPPPATPASASPPSVASGLSSVNVVVTGTSSSGSGFYDTPSSMSVEPCRTRLTAAVSSGVTVNSVTYTDPTHVTLNLNTVSAATGARNVTVTNPDGQSAVGSGILTITTTCTPPPAPVVTAPSVVGAGSPNRVASVASHAGSTYAWIVSNGTITAGQGTSQITFTAGSEGIPLGISVTETNSSGCTSPEGDATVTVLPAGSAVLFYTVTPCRQLDTRTGPGTPIAAAGTLTVPLTGAPCGIPSGATSVSVNVTVTQAAAPGYLTIYPADGTQPTTTNINFKAGQSRANNAILDLSGDGTGRVNVFNGSAGTVQVIIDVNGYFQ